MPIDPEHPLAVGARMIDDLRVAQGYVGALREMGLDVDDVEYISRQRAYRVWLLLKGGPELVEQYNAAGLYVPMPEMGNEDKQLIEVLTTSAAAAIVLGWTARGVAQSRRGHDDQDQA